MLAHQWTNLIGYIIPPLFAFSPLTVSLSQKSQCGISDPCPLDLQAPADAEVVTRVLLPVPFPGTPHFCLWASSARLTSMAPQCLHAELVSLEPECW